MTITPDKELEELDFPTPDITEEDVATLQQVIDTVAEAVAGSLPVVTQDARIVVGPIRFTPSPAPVEFTCWDCDERHDGPAGRCPACTARFAQSRLVTPIPAPAIDPLEVQSEVERRMRLAAQRDREERYRIYAERDWYCYCSPTRAMRLGYDRTYGGGGGRDYEEIARQDALRHRRLRAEYHDRMMRELMASAPAMTARTWLPGDEQAEVTADMAKAVAVDRKPWWRRLFKT